MNKLLIHSNNTSFNRIEFFPLSEQFVFDVDLDKDVDFYINEILSEGNLEQKILKADIVFIKVALSENYLEYLGIRLAYHIRLTKSLGDKAKLPIVFIAEESFQFLGLTYPEPSILLTQWIYLIRETENDFHEILNRFHNNNIKPLKDFDSFLNVIHISPPANYQSHHSIANEWALARYFSMLAKNEQANEYIRLREKIQDLNYLKTLHFKYTEAQSDRQKFNPKKHTYNPQVDGIKNIRIGIIDDEINKGWLDFYAYVFNKSNAQTIPFRDFRKDDNKANLVDRIKKWLLDNLQSNEPIELFIIDLRLHDDDFSEQDFERITGIQIIDFIKSINPGIQIVVSTASNKVWNYQKCLECGVKYFALKESPETYNTREESKINLIHMLRQIELASQKTFLAVLYRDIQHLKANNLLIKNAEVERFKSLIFGENGVLDQIFNLLIQDTVSEAILNQCLLLCFQVLENYCDLPIVGSFGVDTSLARLSSGFVWLKSDKKLDVFINQQNQKIATYFELINGKFDFQAEESNETPVTFKAFDKMQILSSYKSGVDASSLVKIISVLYFREDIPASTINKIIKLRYYRSNVAAHNTGKMKSGYKRIDAQDIVFFFQIFRKVFC